MVASALAVALEAAVLTVGAARLLGSSSELLAGQLAGAGAAFAYAIDRAVDRGALHRGLIVTGVLWCAVACWTAATGHAHAALHSIAYPVSVALYVIPWMRWRLGGIVVRRIKDVPLAKPLYVDFMWSQLGASAAARLP